MSGEPFDAFDDGTDEREEAELFARRRVVLRPPVALEARVLAAVGEVAAARSSRRTRVASATRLALALAACVAAVAGDPAALRGALHSARGESSSLTTSLAISIDGRGASFDEPLACALPASGFVRASDRVAACGMREGAPSSMRQARALFSAPDHQLCEEVTSSFARP